MISSGTKAQIDSQAAARRVCEDVQRMVVDTIDQPDPTAPRRTFRFLLLTRRTNNSIGKLAQATKALEAEAVARQDPSSAASIRARFARARTERDVNLLLAIVRDFAGPIS